MDKLKKFWNDHNEAIVVLGVATVFTGIVGVRHGRQIRGMKIDSVVGGLVNDGNEFAINIRFKDGCWQGYGWYVEALKQAALDAAAKELETANG